MPRSTGPIRGFVAVCLAAGLVVSACGGTSPATAPPTPGGSSNVAPGLALTPGLASNLDTLDSYQFTRTSLSVLPAVGASPSRSGSITVSGIVVNKGIRSLWVNNQGFQYTVIGSRTWDSPDGKIWSLDTSGTTTVSDLLPNEDYVTWFDANAADMMVAGDEPKNGVQCVHYTADGALISRYSGPGGSASTFKADLWIAKDGNYPVSGVFGSTAPAGGEGTTFLTAFDITHVNDPANVIIEPGSVIPVSTDTPASSPSPSASS